MIVIRVNSGVFYPAGGRGVLHTPLKYPIRDHSALCKDTSPLPSAAYVGRMQYAPTAYG